MLLATNLRNHELELEKIEKSRVTRDILLEERVGMVLGAVVAEIEVGEDLVHPRPVTTHLPAKT